MQIKTTVLTPMCKTINKILLFIYKLSGIVANSPGLLSVTSNEEAYLQFFIVSNQRKCHLSIPLTNLKLQKNNVLTNIPIIRENIIMKKGLVGTD